VAFGTTHIDTPYEAATVTRFPPTLANSIDVGGTFILMPPRSPSRVVSEFGIASARNCTCGGPFTVAGTTTSACTLAGLAMVMRCVRHHHAPPPTAARTATITAAVRRRFRDTATRRLATSPVC
jgi:hypothetical protein